MSGKERNTKRNAHVELNVEPDLHKDSTIPWETEAPVSFRPSIYRPPKKRRGPEAEAIKSRVLQSIPGRPQKLRNNSRLRSARGTAFVQAFL